MDSLNYNHSFYRLLDSGPLTKYRVSKCTRLRSPPKNSTIRSLVRMNRNTTFNPQQREDGLEIYGD